MAGIHDVWQPFIQASVQGKEAVRSSKSALGREEYDARVQALRQKRADDMQLQGLQFNTAQKLMDDFGPERTRQMMQGAAQKGLYYPDVLSAGQTKSDMMSSRFLDELTKTGPLGPMAQVGVKSGLPWEKVLELKQYDDKQAQLAEHQKAVLAAAQAKAAGGASRPMSKYGVDYFSNAQYRQIPEMSDLAQKLAEARANLAAQKSVIDAEKRQGAINGGVNMNAIRQQTDSLAGTENLISTLMGDSANVMDLLKAQNLGMPVQQSFSDQDIEDYLQSLEQ